MIKLEIASEILHNMADECSAQAGYSTLMNAMIEAKCDQEDINIISEIQSDERNHALKLFNLAQKYNGVLTTNDDAKKILEGIKDGFV